ncbi:MAG: lipopolysaccharide assembly protein LapA domain-containing protein [Alphaproteobacteria bacterium]
MKVLFWLLGLPVLVAAVAFALSNRETVALEVWPLPYVLELPAYAAILGAVFAGFLCGAVWAWMSGGKWRRRARAGARKLKPLERENEELRKQLAAAEARQNVPDAAETRRRLAAAELD